VAGSALPWLRRSVVEARPQPSRRIEVTRFTRSVGNDMRIRFGGGDDALASGVATITRSWRALEHPADVAGFTGSDGVPARQNKASGHVIEVAPARLRSSEYLHRKHR